MNLCFNIYYARRTIDKYESKVKRAFFTLLGFQKWLVPTQFDHVNRIRTSIMFGTANAHFTSSYSVFRTVCILYCRKYNATVPYIFRDVEILPLLYCLSRTVTASSIAYRYRTKIRLKLVPGLKTRVQSQADWKGIMSRLQSGIFLEIPFQNHL